MKTKRIKYPKNKKKTYSYNKACERVYQTISKDLLSIILDVKNYNYNIENDYTIIIYKYNNIIHASTKYKPLFLFYNHSEIIKENVHNNCKKKFKNVYLKAFTFNVGDKIVLNPKFLISGDNIISNIYLGKIIKNFIK